MQSATPLLLLILLVFAPAAWAGAGLHVAKGAGEKERPVAKVIALLKDMTSQLQKEGDEDEDVYQQMGCWCETNDKAKTVAIADGKQRVSSLGALIEELTANGARLGTEISNLQKEVAENSKTVDQATALRAKQLAEFNAEEKDMLQSISSMKSAIVSLKKHNRGASLEQDTHDHSHDQSHGSKTLDKATIDILTSVNREVHDHSELLRESITPRQRNMLKALVQQGGAAGYAPQSGEIFGILAGMKESFEQNLANAQRDEVNAQKAFEGVKQAKSGEIAAGSDQIDAKTGELAAAGERASASKKDLEQTSAVLAADIKFLADLKDKCANADKDYEERTKTRQLEMQAVSKALEFLSSDEAHELFDRSINSFVQKAQESPLDAVRRAKVVAFLDASAKKLGNPALSTLAVQARMDAFANLKKSVENQIETLQKEAKDEVKQKDFCVEQLNENSRDTEGKTQERDDSQAKFNDLKEQVDEMKRAITELKSDVTELHTQLKRVGQEREAANKDFQTTIADQRATIKLLQTALGILKGFYEKAALVQSKSKGKVVAKGAEPAFKTYEKSAKSGGVMGMIEDIVADAKALEAEAVRGEEEAQKSYEEFVLDTNEVIDKKTKEIASQAQQQGKSEGEMLDTEVELDGINQELEQYATQAQDIHRSCNFLLKNWEIRTAAREQEMEALKQAVALFSGAKFGALLQHLG